MEEKKNSLDRDYLKNLVLMLAPFAPFYAEEWWSRLGENKSVHISHWPDYDPEKIVFDTVVVAVQINGKTRATLEVDSGKVEDQSFVESEAKNNEKMKKYLEGTEPKKVIYVKGKIINFVI